MAWSVTMDKDMSRTDEYLVIKYHIVLTNYGRYRRLRLLTVLSMYNVSYVVSALVWPGLSLWMRTCHGQTSIVSSSTTLSSLTMVGSLL